MTPLQAARRTPAPETEAEIEPVPAGPGSPGGLHVAIIMDGNGRWALARGRARMAGHEAGAGAVRRAVEAAPDLGIGTLTLFAFSSDNWKRPPAEVGSLMRLLRSFLAREAARCAAKGMRIAVFGRRDRLPAGVVRAIEAAEAATRGARRFLLRIAVDYSARDAIVAAARRVHGHGAALSRDDFARLLAEAEASAGSSAGGTRGSGIDVDLLIRTGGERRLSDFLLWECAYAELVFSDRMWPDFAAEDLAAAVAEFHSRERRFGTVGAAAAHPRAVAAV